MFALAIWASESSCPFSNLLYELIIMIFNQCYSLSFCFPHTHFSVCLSRHSFPPGILLLSMKRLSGRWAMEVQFIKQWNSVLNFLPTKYKDSIFWAEKTQPDLSFSLICFHWMPCRSVNSRSLCDLYLKACCE